MEELTQYSQTDPVTQFYIPSGVKLIDTEFEKLIPINNVTINHVPINQHVNTENFNITQIKQEFPIKWNNKVDLSMKKTRNRKKKDKTVQTNTLFNYI